jgi:hypothetical protein
MSLFEALYGRKCSTLVSWYNPTYKTIIGLELLREMEEKMVKIKHNLKVPHDKKKSYADKNMPYMEFKEGNHVFLKLKAKRSSLRLRSFPKLAARYYGSFETLEKI